MIHELGDMVNSLAVTGWDITFGAVYASIGVGFVVAIRDEIKKSRAHKAKFDTLRDSYSEGMNAHELEAYYIRLHKLGFGFGQRKRQSDELKRKVAAQLEPIIDAEIREAVQSHQGLLPRDERLREMSAIYRRIKDECNFECYL